MDWLTIIGVLVLLVGAVFGAVLVLLSGRGRDAIIAVAALAAPMIGFHVGDLSAPCRSNDWLCLFPKEAVVGFRIGIAVGLILISLLWVGAVQGVAGWKRRRTG